MPRDASHSTATLVFDRSSALERLGGDEQLFRELATYFREDSVVELSKIEQAIERQDWMAARMAAHSLKGLAANFSAATTTEAARETEDAAHNGDGERVRELFPKLRREVERLSEALADAAG